MDSRIFERSIDATLLVSGGRIRRANGAAAQLLGWAREALEGVTLIDLFGADAEILSRRDIARGEIAFARAGEPRRLDFALSRDVDGDFDMIVLRDVTARRLREELWERYQLLSENAHDIVLFLRKDGRILEANAAAAHAYGYSRDELRRLSITELRAPSTRDSVPSQIEEAYAEGAVFETLHMRRDGSTFPAEVSSRSAAIGEEHVLLSIIRDVTERNQMQARLVQADRMAAVGTLAAGVAHEINNPLAYAVTNLEVLDRTLAKIRRRLNDGDDCVLNEIDAAQEMLAVAREGTDRVRAIVRDLKTFSRADDQQRGPVDVRVVLDSCVKLAAAELRHRARLVRRYADVPPVEANESRLAQVFLNLLVNAAQACEPGQADRHEIRVVVGTDENGFAVVEVEDDGGGIPESLRSRIFDPFVSTKPIGEGTGLGLFISRDIVTALGGSIDVESSVGVGTRMRVSLPPATQVLRPPSSSRKLFSELPARLPRLLVIDDEDSIGLTVRRALDGEFRVTVATSGREALSLLLDREAEFDAVLCDVIMPDVDGRAVHAAVRARNAALAEKFVFMTGGVLTGDMRAFVTGMRGRTVEKPFVLDDLRDALRRRFV